MIYPTFKSASEHHTNKFKRAPEVHAQKWQGMDISERPEAKMIELILQDMRIALRTEDLDVWREEINPNLPWADDHFDERVCGFPLNPGTQWAKWPWGNSAKAHLDLEGERFNHNYMERYWPKYAGILNVPTYDTEESWLEWNTKPGSRDGIITGEGEPFRFAHARQGIRSEYADLNNLIETLAHEPDTRQAYLPIWFPEDGTVDGRKPCSLGYHFIMRHGYLHVTYYMRSCDFYRHWADDCYLTVRLLLWILDRCREKNPDIWNDIKPGFFNMHIASLHMFINDAATMGIERR
jgi:thymidylate synthase